jgi:hypothetical protein
MDSWIIVRSNDETKIYRLIMAPELIGEYTGYSSAVTFEQLFHVRGQRIEQRTKDVERTQSKLTHNYAFP